jgi:hypothetical protein
MYANLYTQYRMTPGPGEYTVQRSLKPVGNVAAVAFRSKTDRSSQHLSDNSSKPGPGQYDPCLDFRKNSAASAALAKKSDLEEIRKVNYCPA